MKPNFQENCGHRIQVAALLSVINDEIWCVTGDGFLPETINVLTGTQRRTGLSKDLAVLTLGQSPTCDEIIKAFTARVKAKPTFASKAAAIQRRIQERVAAYGITFASASGRSAALRRPSPAVLRRRESAIVRRMDELATELARVRASLSEHGPSPTEPQGQA